MDIPFDELGTGFTGFGMIALNWYRGFNSGLSGFRNNGRNGFACSYVLSVDKSDLDIKQMLNRLTLLVSFRCIAVFLYRLDLQVQRKDSDILH